MSKKKSNKWPLFYFTITLSVFVWALIVLLSDLSPTPGRMRVVATLYGAASAYIFYKLIKNGFFSFLKLKRFQLPFWIVATLTLEFFVYINNAHGDIGMLIVNIFFLCLSLIFLGRVFWKVLSETGYDDPSL